MMVVSAAVVMGVAVLMIARGSAVMVCMAHGAGAKRDCLHYTMSAHT
jgi:hypothetical protein